MMDVVLFTNSISAHQLPFAREIVSKIGADKFRYVYTGALQGGGQEVQVEESWITRDCNDLLSCKVLLSGIRDLDLFERRAQKGLKTFYMSERFFKPIRGLTGRIRLLVPSYFRMTRRLLSLLKEDENFYYFAIGPWARRDMMGLGCPLSKIVDWGYFVAPSTLPPPTPTTSTSKRALRVLWVGRMLNWKRVDTIIRAVAEVAKRGKQISCTIVGSGPEEPKLKKLANSIVDLHLLSRPNSLFTFLPPVPIAQVRELMRQHDVYVLSSNGEEGWGAALNEAIEEGMCALGTFEAGASAAILPLSNLYHAGGWRSLADKLSQNTSFVPIGNYGVDVAARNFMEKL